MVFFQIRQQKGLRITWSKRPDSFVKLIPRTLSPFMFQSCIPPSSPFYCPHEIPIVGPQEYDYDMGIRHNDYGINLSFI
jgi:hypothetical protein